MNTAEKRTGFQLDPEAGYFTDHGVDVIAFEDIYPAGHQSGVSVIMHGERLAANGDVRFEPTPGQWQPVPVQVSRDVDVQNREIKTVLRYPDEKNHLKGFNPIVYPDCAFDYAVRVKAEGTSLLLTVDMLTPVADAWRDSLCFNLELFPGLLFGKPWIMDNGQGIFPRQPAGPVLRQPSLVKKGILPQSDTTPENAAALLEEGAVYSPLRGEEEISEPYAAGRCFTVCPDDPLLCLTVEALDGEMSLYDGRMNHNNGWFVLSTPLSFAEGKPALRWRLTPNVMESWLEKPKIQVSQVGYLPSQPKVAVIELDKRDTAERTIMLERIERNGSTPVLSCQGTAWGRFLRYRYLQFDFSAVTEPGLYRISCGDAASTVFRIGEDVYSRGVWQPVLEYFLPIQMCHMRVSEKYRVWHGLCHQDDARMAKTPWQLFDGYDQGKSTLTKWKPGEFVPGLNRGGWHDAGDFDLRVESQSGEAYLLALAYEAFHVEWDSTAIDQRTKTVEIHCPDGENDILQQIEHGALAVLGGWRALGRLYRGIIESHLRQYVMLGDPMAMTDGAPGDEDDRLVFTEDNPFRELTTAAHLAAVSRALKDFRPALAEEALQVARTLFSETTPDNEQAQGARLHAAAELFLTTGEEAYQSLLLSNASAFARHARFLGWIAARVAGPLNDAAFTETVKKGMIGLKAQEEALAAETPYGVPYRPHIWGDGWQIQRLGCEHYYLCRAFPDIFTPDVTFNALHFVLGCHPGRSVSFASGIGASSVTTAYGFNRGDFSYIPGGVVSGTALIRPDFPELKEWPYLWQQTEYVLGGGSSRFMFLVLAVQALAGVTVE